jgi:hypothetical protein
MKKLTKYQLKKISKNLDYYFNYASAKDIKDGMQWYKNANDICKDIAKKYNTNVFIAAQVISAISPRNKWEQNIKDAYSIFEAIKHGTHPEDIKICTFHTNKFKAFNIVTNNVQICDKSLKTYNFVHNIALLSNEHLTIDIWHLRACFNESINIGSASIGRLAYEQIKSLTIRKADKLGLKGYEYQAIIWNSIRK